MEPLLPDVIRREAENQPVLPYELLPKFMQRLKGDPTLVARAVEYAIPTSLRSAT